LGISDKPGMAAVVDVGAGPVWREDALDGERGPGCGHERKEFLRLGRVDEFPVVVANAVRREPAEDEGRRGIGREPEAGLGFGKLERGDLGIRPADEIGALITEKDNRHRVVRADDKGGMDIRRDWRQKGDLNDGIGEGANFHGVGTEEPIEIAADLRMENTIEGLDVELVEGNDCHFLSDRRYSNFSIFIKLRRRTITGRTGESRNTTEWALQATDRQEAANRA
jgi:hypothetical protein